MEIRERPSQPESRQKFLLKEAEAKIFSQFNEDGILRMLLERVGAGSRRFVEFGIGNGKECNTANLSINGGWSGLLMDGNLKDVEKAQKYYASRPEIGPGQVKVKHAFITRNINGLLADHAHDGPTDLLSVDIDGNDLWVWRAIAAIEPRGGGDRIQRGVWADAVAEREIRCGI